MTTYSVRCRNGQCRHRRVIARHPDSYMRPPACEVCGQRAGWRIEARTYNQRGLCTCGQVVGRDGPYPHRTTHHDCAQHPEGARNAMRRAGADELDIALELGGAPAEETEPCPF